MTRTYPHTFLYPHTMMTHARIEETCKRLASGELTIRRVRMRIDTADDRNEEYLETMIQTLASGCTLTQLTFIGTSDVLHGDAMCRMVAALGTHHTPLRELTWEDSMLNHRSITAICDAIANDTWSIRRLDLWCRIDNIVRLVRATLSPRSRLTEIHLPTLRDHDTSLVRTIVHLLQTGRSSLRYVAFYGDTDMRTYSTDLLMSAMKNTHLDTVRVTSVLPRRIAETLKHALYLQQRCVLYRRLSLRIRLCTFCHR